MNETSKSHKILANQMLFFSCFIKDNIFLRYEFDQEREKARNKKILTRIRKKTKTPKNVQNCSNSVSNKQHKIDLEQNLFITKIEKLALISLGLRPGIFRWRFKRFIVMKKYER